MTGYNPYDLQDQTFAAQQRQAALGVSFGEAFNPTPSKHYQRLKNQVMREITDLTRIRSKFSVGDNAGTANLALHIQETTGSSL